MEISFELYLKSGSGKAFVYKQLVKIASAKTDNRKELAL